MHYIYLAGPIAGQTYYDAKLGWRSVLSDELAGLPHVQVLSPMRGKEFLSGHKGKLEAFEGHVFGPGEFASPRGTMTRDFADIDRCSLVVLGLLSGADRVSVGSMIELGYALKAGKPICLLHDGAATNVHSHGWIFEAADYQCASVVEVGTVVKLLFSEGL